MKKSLIAMAAAVMLLTGLTACSGRDQDVNGGAGQSGSNSQNGSNSQSGQASTNRTSASRRYMDGYLDDGRYYANADGQVNGGSVARDFTQGARDMMRGVGDAAADVGRDVDRAARDLTGTPSWEPDSSARY